MLGVHIKKPPLSATLTEDTFLCSSTALAFCYNVNRTTCKGVLLGKEALCRLFMQHLLTNSDQFLLKIKIKKSK